MSTISQIRHLTPELFARLQQLTDQLTPQPMTLDEEVIRELIASPHSHLYVAIEAEEIAGMLTLGCYHSPTGRKAWIEDVVVDAAYRDRGIGADLVRHAIDEARRLGVEQLMLTSNPLREAANRLYQRMGFERKMTNCYKMDKGL